MKELKLSAGVCVTIGFEKRVQNRHFLRKVPTFEQAVGPLELKITLKYHKKGNLPAKGGLNPWTPSHIGPGPAKCEIQCCKYILTMWQCIVLNPTLHVGFTFCYKLQIFG